MSEKLDAVSKTLAKMQLTMDTVFVPFSQSRNKAEKTPSLNWKVTIKRNDKAIVTTDYMMGCDHTPSYKHGKKTWDDEQLIKAECETGYKNRHGYSLFVILPNKKAPILPKIEDVIYSLLIDSEVLDYEFEDWCDNFGYEQDSRKAEKIYHECMDIALKLNRSLGTDGLNTLREVYQDY